MDTAPLSLPKTDANACTLQVLPTSTIGLTIFVTCYNLERYIRKTLASVFAQDYKGPMEVIIVDDCSTDNSWEVIQKTVAELGQGWDVTLIRNEQNMGIAVTTEVAWAAAKYEWLVEADGDDIQMPGRCSKVAEVIQNHPNVGCIIFSAQGMDENDNVTNSYYAYDCKTYETAEEELWLDTPDLLFSKRIGDEEARHIVGFGATSTYRKSIFEKWGSALTRSREQAGIQDNIWTWRTMLSLPVYCSKYISCYYRSHSSNLVNYATGRKYSEHIREQLSAARFRRLSMYSCKTAVSDTIRALTEPGLSNWSREKLTICQQQFEKWMQELQIVCDWWEIPWSQHLRRYICLRKNYPPSIQHWMLKHIFPLPITAFICWMRDAVKKS